MARIRLTFHGSVLLMTVAALLVMAVAPARQLHRELSRVEAAEERLADVRRDNAAMEQHLARLEDPAYLEMLARSELGLVRPGEIGYVVVPGEPAREADSRAEPEQAWYERLLGSLRRLVGG